MHSDTPTNTLDQGDRDTQHLRRRRMRAVFIGCVLGAVSVGGCAVSDGGARGHAAPEAHSLLHTKTPYQARQSISELANPPQGYVPVYTQLLARHGSRGLTGPKSDLALYRLWQQAEAQGALTPLGQSLGPALLEMMRANVTLGEGSPFVANPGYGNLTATGIAEHEGLAQRMLLRDRELFHDTRDKDQRRSLVLLTSGKDRAVDSSQVFSSQVLQSEPGLRGRVVYGETEVTESSAAPAPFLLYFHRLPVDTAERATWKIQVGADSQAYRKYLKDDQNLKAAKSLARERSSVATSAQRVALRLFTPAFIERLQRGEIGADNSGEVSVFDAVRRRQVTVQGDASVHLHSTVDVAAALYDLYAASHDMVRELRMPFTSFLPEQDAAVFAELDNREDYLEKGPGLPSAGDVTYRMARGLFADFWAEVDAIQRGDLRHLAKLRFAHAEIVIPFASALKLKTADAQISAEALSADQPLAWQGSRISPMAGNIQWDVFQNAEKHLIVRMLLNEGEVDFWTGCEAAKLSPKSYFYDYDHLRTCYLRLHGPAWFVY